MSTILEALRKLQAERQQPKETPQELRTSLVQTNYAPRPVTKSRRWNPVWIGVTSGAAVVAIAVGALTFFGGTEEGIDPLERAAAVEPRPRAETPAPPPPPPITARTYQPPAPVEPETEDVPPASSRRQLAAAPEASSEARRVRPQPRRRPPAQNPVVPAPSIERPPDINFRPPPEAAPEEEYQQVEVPPYVPPNRRDPGLERSPGSSTSVASAASTRREARTPRAVLSGPEVRSRPEPQPVKEVRKDQVISGEPRDTDAVGFPEVLLESVTWHPDRDRRRATLTIDGMRSEGVREGDLLEGLMVDRIDPGSVDLRIGNDLKRVSVGS